jgi:hypothetical protein
MFISLPDRVPPRELLRNLALVIESLEADSVAAVSEVRIELRAFDLDDRENYPADRSTGEHDMGVTVSRRDPAGANSASILLVSWTVPGSKPKPIG